MVKHNTAPMASSRKRRNPDFEFQAAIESDVLLPDKLDTQVFGSEYEIMGTLREEAIRRPGDGPRPESVSAFRSLEDCEEPPHFALANVLVDDPQAAENFIRRYGPLTGTYTLKTGESGFMVTKRELKTIQDEVRAAWTGDSVAIMAMESRVVENTAVDVEIDSSGRVALKPRDLWTLVSFLILRDHHKRTLAICANPDCPAPYFRRKRRTQKICEQGPCVVYAQRKYSLDWWNRKGKKRRERKMKHQSGRKG